MSFCSITGFTPYVLSQKNIPLLRYAVNGHKLNIPKGRSPAICKGFWCFVTPSKVQIMSVRSITCCQEIHNGKKTPSRFLRRVKPVIVDSVLASVTVQPIPFVLSHTRNRRYRSPFSSYSDHVSQIIPWRCLAFSAGFDNARQ